MNNSEIIEKISENPIIAAVRDLGTLDEAVGSGANAVFMLTGDICDSGDTVKKIHDGGKLAFLHLDLIDGLGLSTAGVNYVATRIKPDGIITTRSNLIRHADDMGLFSILRLFLIDSIFLDKGIKTLEQTQPDAIEILPGVMPKIVRYCCQRIKQPIITGGMVTAKEDVLEALNAGAIAVSTSAVRIWNM